MTNSATSRENPVRLCALDIEALAFSTLGEANAKFSDEGKRGTSVAWLASRSQPPRRFGQLLHNPG